MPHLRNFFLFTGGFTVIALASRQIGNFFVKFKLPLISGFLATGILTGPYALNLISAEAVENLRFVDEIALAFIAFAAGSELYLQQLRSCIKGIAWVTLGNAVAIPVFGAVTVFFLADFIPFTRVMPFASRLAVALLAGAILVARSPSSAIAIVNELRACGPFTQTVLGVTMITDVVVIFLFAFATSVADALLTGVGFDFGFIGLLLFELLLSLILGFILGKLGELALSLRLNELVKSAIILLAGYGVFLLSAAVRDFSGHWLPFELFLEPLLVCMIGSFVITNSPYRTEFLQILQDTGPPVYIAFFTLTGASLALNVLVQTWPIALALFGARLLAIFVGSFGGGLAAGLPFQQNRLGWMTYITQAGVGLGLAKEVGVEFPEWGPAFATVIISVIVLSQLVGPPFFKWAIVRSGEAHPRAESGHFDGQRQAIIFGLEGQSLALARQLQAHGWQIKIVTRLKNFRQDFPAAADFDVIQCSKINLDALRRLQAENADAVVMLMSDETNYHLCELIYEYFGTKDVVVRLNDRANFERFHRLGALIVDPATAIVSLYDHLVRSPAAASLLLGLEDGQDIVDLEVRNPHLHGIPLRDLRLPLDTLVLSVHRNGRSLISHGYTRLKVGDRVTIVGAPDNLDELMLRFEA